MGIWLGGLVLLLFNVRSIGIFEVRRYSTLAFIMMTLIVIGGVLQAVRQVGSIDALTEPATERSSSGSLVFVSALVLVYVAAVSRQIVRRDPLDRPRLGRAIAIEVVDRRGDRDRHLTADGREPLVGRHRQAVLRAARRQRLHRLDHDRAGQGGPQRDAHLPQQPEQQPHRTRRGEGRDQRSRSRPGADPGAGDPQRCQPLHRVGHDLPVRSDVDDDDHGPLQHVRCGELHHRRPHRLTHRLTGSDSRQLSGVRDATFRAKQLQASGACNCLHASTHSPARWAAGNLTGGRVRGRR